MSIIFPAAQGQYLRFKNIQDPVNKEAAKSYLTYGNKYPKTNPECTQYVLGAKGESCGVSEQSFKLKAAINSADNSSNPWMKLSYVGKGYNIGTDHEGDGTRKPFYDINSPSYRDSMLTSLDPSDDVWPKDMGYTGNGLQGYKACETLCNNDERCAAFESALPIAKTYNTSTNKWEDDKNAKFACILWGNTGDESKTVGGSVPGDNYKGVAYVSGGQTSIRPNPDARCWVKKCQNDLKYTYNKASFETSPGDWPEIYRVHFPQGLGPQTTSVDFNRTWKTTDPTKNYTDVIFGEATLKDPNEIYDRDPYCCGWEDKSWPLVMKGSPSPPSTSPAPSPTPSTAPSPSTSPAPSPTPSSPTSSPTPSSPTPSSPTPTPSTAPSTDPENETDEEGLILGMTKTVFGLAVGLASFISMIIIIIIIVLFSAKK